jgi:hypothetical protein
VKARGANSTTAGNQYCFVPAIEIMPVLVKASRYGDVKITRLPRIRLGLIAFAESAWTYHVRQRGLYPTTGRLVHADWNVVVKYESNSSNGGLATDHKPTRNTRGFRQNRQVRPTTRRAHTPG